MCVHFYSSCFTVAQCAPPWVLGMWLLLQWRIGYTKKDTITSKNNLFHLTCSSLISLSHQSQAIGHSFQQCLHMLCWDVILYAILPALGCSRSSRTTFGLTLALSFQQAATTGNVSMNADQKLCLWWQAGPWYWCDERLPDDPCSCLLTSLFYFAGRGISKHLSLTLRCLLSELLRCRRKRIRYRCGVLGFGVLVCVKKRWG